MGFLNSRAARLSGYEQGSLTPLIVVDWLPKEYRYTDPPCYIPFSQCVLPVFCSPRVNYNHYGVESSRKRLFRVLELPFCEFSSVTEHLCDLSLQQICTWLFDPIIH